MTASDKLRERLEAIRAAADDLIVATFERHLLLCAIDDALARLYDTAAAVDAVAATGVPVETLMRVELDLGCPDGANPKLWQARVNEALRNLRANGWLTHPNPNHTQIANYRPDHGRAIQPRGAVL
jgi:DNA-binding response OmpR family regulator